MKKYSALINKIYIIESLRPNDELTGEKLFRNIIAKNIDLDRKGITLNYIFTESKIEFIDKLESILKDIKSDDEIIIHIEAHGGNEEMQFGNYELIKWTELEEYLIHINLACKNKLHLNLATCHGMHVAERISLTKTAPYKSYISALRTLSPDEIYEDNSILYKEVIKTRNIFSSYIEFCKQKPKTQLRIKDVETVVRMILRIQISRSVTSRNIIKDFFDSYLNIKIDNQILSKLKSEKEITDYILGLFFSRYLPK